MARIGIEIPDDVYRLVEATIPASDMKKQGAFNRALVVYIRRAVEQQAELADARRQISDLTATVKALATGGAAPVAQATNALATVNNGSVINKDGW